MNDRIKAVVRGFENLNKSEREELIEELNKSIRRIQKGDIVEGTVISLGPVPGGCPCCGR